MSSIWKYSIFSAEESDRYCTWNCSLTYVPSAGIEGEGFINHTAAGHQGAIQMCRLQIWEPSQSLFTAVYADKYLDKVYIKSVRGWCVTLLLLPPCGQKLTLATNITFCVWHTVRFTQNKHYVFIQPVHHTAQLQRWLMISVLTEGISEKAMTSLFLNLSLFGSCTNVVVLRTS